MYATNGALVANMPAPDFTPEQIEVLEQNARAVMIQILRGNHRAAHQILEQAAVQLEAQQEHGELLRQKTLADCGVELRNLNRLDSIQVLTIDDLLHCNIGDLLMIPDFGPKSLIAVLVQLLATAVRRDELLVKEIERLETVHA